MKKVREYFSDKTGEQIFSLSLLVGVVAIMLLCLIARSCGILWFAADLKSIKEPSRFWQEIIKSGLLIFELVFVYKILCRKSWAICFAIAIGQTAAVAVIVFTTNNSILSNIFNMACILFIPIFFVKSWFSLLENAILYLISMLYGVIFLIGRIGGISGTSAYGFTENILGMIDYKLFIVSLYLFVKYFGGIKIWKKQKRLIFQTELNKTQTTE